MGVSKNRGIPKWMVKIMENPIKMDDLGVPLFLETPIYNSFNYSYCSLTVSLMISFHETCFLHNLSSHWDGSE